MRHNFIYRSILQTAILFKSLGGTIIEVNYGPVTHLLK